MKEEYSEKEKTPSNLGKETEENKETNAWP
jgi:hypothetical protein